MMLQLFRVLLPSWKFFDGIVDAPELWYQLSHQGVVVSDWTLCIPKVGKRSWKKLFINTEENYFFACHALIEYLKDDLNDQSDAQVSLELTRNLVDFQIKNSKTAIQFTHFQFKMGDYLSPLIEGKI